MLFDNLDAELLETFGQAGSYTLAGGSAVACKILLEESTDAFGTGFDTRHQDTERTAFVLASVATNSKKGDALTVGATSYQVREVLSNDGLLVKLSVRS